VGFWERGGKSGFFGKEENTTLTPFSLYLYPAACIVNSSL
jgi:hypothetical protein